MIWLDKALSYDYKFYKNKELDKKVYNLQQYYKKNYQVQCECSRKQYIQDNQEYVICDWCGKKIYRSGSNKFKYELRKRLDNEKS